MFKKFRIWMAVYVSADLVLMIVQAALGGRDSEQYEGALAIVINAIEFLCAVGLFTCSGRAGVTTHISDRSQWRKGRQ